jgi:hemoglobin
MTPRIPHAPLALVLGAALLLGCASEETKDDDFYTSGSREADQRAEQRISRVQQLRGEGEGTDGKRGAQDLKKLTLYERLGGERGLTMIVDDFVDRAMADPRVNWTRKGVERGGVLGIGAKPAEWRATPDQLAHMKKHMAQFIAVATGGPTRYDGRDIKLVHTGLGITNAEFDASIGDLKATLDALRVPTEEQKELLSVLESARPQITEDR